MTFGCKLCTIVKLLWGRPQLKLHNNKWKQYSTSSNRPFISQCIFGCFQNSPCKYERYPAFSSLLPSEQSCCGQLLAGRSTGGEFGPGLEEIWKAARLTKTWWWTHFGGFESDVFLREFRGPEHILLSVSYALGTLDVRLRSVCWSSPSAFRCWRLKQLSRLWILGDYNHL